MNTLSCTAVHKTLALLCLMVVVANPLYAANLPSGYPDLDEFQRIGTIDSLQIRANTIVIDDQEYNISPNIIVVMPNRRNSSLKDIQAGKTTGIFFNAGSTQRMPVVNEIWVLPRNIN